MFCVFWFSFILTAYSALAITCRDDANQSVDWFIAHKFPGSYEYAFMVPSSISWHKSPHEINESGMIKNTYDALYSMADLPDSVYAVYNDEKSNSTVYSTWYGHMKGGFAFDSSGLGFWLIHSVPKFAYSGGSYIYPPTGKIYGQHFFCITLPISQLNLLIDQLIVAKPWIQDSYISPNIARDYPNISHLIHDNIQSSGDRSIQPFPSKSGLTMIHFSKGSSLQEDLYKDLVAPALRVGLNVESWQHGNKSDNEPSSCEIPQSYVYNVRKVSFPQFGVNFSSWHDHSKWAVSLPVNTKPDSGQKWVCLGDLNRQYSQYHRGGGTMCIQNDAIWKAFTSIVDEVEPCSSQYTTTKHEL